MRPPLPLSCALLLAAALCPPPAVWALSADLQRDGVGRVLQATVETEHYTLTLDAAKGARVMSLLDKALGADIVRADGSGLGGLFEDRPHFGNALYQGSVVRQTGESLVLRFEVTHTDGVKLVKTYEFTEGTPIIRVGYEIENPTQLPFRLWVRNFATPGGEELTQEDRVFLHQEGELQELTFPDTYCPGLTGPWMASVDTAQGSGFFVRCDPDLLDQFYFWSQSRVTPTFEWLYRPVPAGQRTSTGLLFGLLGGLRRVGRVTAEGVATEEEGTPEPLTTPLFTALPDWKPLEELYGPDERERDRGFLLVTSGALSPAPRLRGLEVDLGLHERDAVPLELFGLAESSDVGVVVTGPAAGAIQVQVEDGGWLSAGDKTTVPRGESRRLWLQVSSTGLASGTYAARVRLSAATGPALDIPLQLTVWNARLPQRPLLGTQWYAFLPSLSSYTLDEPARARFLAYLDNMQKLRCDNLDWAVGAHEPAVHLRVRDTGELLTDWGKAHPEATAEKLPDLDFGHYALWFDEPVKRGMTRFVAHLPAHNGWREAALIKAVFPDREVGPDSEEGWAVMIWYCHQLRRYAAEKGFTSFWAKIDDEIAAEHIPGWLTAARRYKAAGWRPFTTNTGGICRSEALLRQMNQESDAWQVALPLSRDFRRLTTMAASYEARREPIDRAWGRYTNGGAVDTWCVLEPLFTGERHYEHIDEVTVFADGVELQLRGGSPWGNEERGVFFTHGAYVYLALPNGGDPNEARIETGYRQRTLRPSDTPAVPLEPTDEVWYYGGGKYSQPYEAARAYAWRAVAWNMRGYGYWTYLWWNGEDVLVRYDEDTGLLQVSAAWEGLRDGNEDADYFLLAEASLRERGDAAGVEKLRSALGTQDEAVLPMGERRAEIYAWDDFIEPTYARYNAAKRRALAVLAR